MDGCYFPWGEFVDHCFLLNVVIKFDSGQTWKIIAEVVADFQLFSWTDYGNYSQPGAPAQRYAHMSVCEG